ncbi:hypothetical protein COMNV_00606 [Commensalibacter sp. Nvir]|uniref:hypothetical protein n=1 Tax=Commensalibacter sp. Nvir TaxID=3069817 RepID=UPI002D3F83AD|nr:hypothetical protein COMNV_00606 [Commensalibacter sp. Nvir]
MNQIINWKEEQIWTVKELAQFLRKAPSTIQSELSRHPEVFPPRIKGFKRPRWDKDIAMQWFKEQSIGARKFVGRPRKINPTF